MQGLFREDAQYCTPYMDDVVIFSASWEDVISNIDAVLGR